VQPDCQGCPFAAESGAGDSRHLHRILLAAHVAALVEAGCAFGPGDLHHQVWLDVAALGRERNLAEIDRIKKRTKK